MTLQANYSDKRVTSVRRVVPEEIPVTPPLAIPIDSIADAATLKTTAISTFWRTWFDAFKRIFHIYLATHLLFLLLTYLASLFALNHTPVKQAGSLSLRTLLLAWFRWDTAQFTAIATKGYDAAWRTAFFPLFPLLERGLMPLTHDPFIAGLIIANVATLVLFTALYRLVQQDFGMEVAKRTILYLAIFPTAFFLVAAYNESLFLTLSVLSFYCMRNRHWWLAGLWGLLAASTRSTGILLAIPFFYEYMRQRQFQWRQIRRGILGLPLIPIGLLLFALYCWGTFHDVLAFSHAQQLWLRHLTWPWKGFSHALAVIVHRPFLSFDAIHNAIDISAGLGMLIIVTLSLVGPWRLPRTRRMYSIYALAVYLLLFLFTSDGGYPLQSTARLVIEIFPAFILLAIWGRNTTFHLYYILLAGAFLSFLLLQFLTGYWIV